MKFSFETIVSVSSEKIWEYYSNTKKWYLWEDDLEYKMIILLQAIKE